MTTQDVTTDRIKELRERTGVSMTKCKEALQATGGNIEAAIDHLRKSGVASAVKKEGRETKEGLIFSASDASSVVLVEINSETDFVAKNDIFLQFAKEITAEVLKTRPASVEAFLSQKLSSKPTETVESLRAAAIQRTGENIVIRRLMVLPKVAGGSVGLYSHMGGKIAVAVELNGQDEELARDIAMHAAAEAPDYLSTAEVPPELTAREEEVARAQMKNKPENMVAKIVEGKLNTFYAQVCLLRQAYVRDTSVTIAQLVEQKAKTVGNPLSVKRFLRWSVGSK